MSKAKFKMLFFSCVFITTTLFGDVNILIIGSEKDTSDHPSIRGNSQAFSPIRVKTELQKILDGANLGTVKVILEDRHRNQSGKQAYNMTSWFHWPYPADIETTTRWPKLRGEKGTKWDFVILIGDSYTIENMPGLYSHGVAKVAEEVAKGSAKTILLMPWPSAKSKSTVAHYKEVIYRTGRSGGFKVVPAALAWEATGKSTGSTHPSKDGAYIAAASIYSRIWNKSAKESSYSYNDKLAEIVHQTVNNNVRKQQYSGKFDFQSPFRMFSNQSRVVSPVKSGGGSSTEVDLIGRTNDAISRAGALNGKGSRYTIGRYTGRNPKQGKDYRNKGGRAFGYIYHTEGNNADSAVGNIVGWEMFLASNMIRESDDFRLIPRRILLGGLLQFNPSMTIVRGGHAYGPQATSQGTYIYTLISGRCPIDPQPESITEQWNSQKVGYEMAWRVTHCQTRAPGFKVMPSNKNRHTIGSKRTEEITIQFIMAPKSPVTVNLKTDLPTLAIVNRQSLTFTPDNYNIPQTVSISVTDEAKPGTEVNVNFKTISEDEVYNDLQDNWAYKVNTPPLANNLEAKASPGKIEPITLTGSDTDGEILTYSLDKKPTNGALTVSSAGLATYTSNKGYIGSDSFSFRTHDGSVYSKPASVTITVTLPSLYDSNLLQNASGELTPLTKYSWIENKGKWQQGENAIDGIYTFAVAEGKEAELAQDVDVSSYSKAVKAGKQTFKLSGLIDRSNDTVYAVVEFLDSSKKVLLSCDSQELMSKKKSRSALKYFESIQLAPAQTAIIRFRLLSNNTGRGKSNGGRFDNLKLMAVKTNKEFTQTNLDKELK